MIDWTKPIWLEWPDGRREPAEQRWSEALDCFMAKENAPDKPWWLFNPDGTHRRPNPQGPLRVINEPPAEPEPAPMMQGVPLRDWFAGQALAGMLARHEVLRSEVRTVASDAYLVADAMMAERAKKGTTE